MRLPVPFVFVLKTKPARLCRLFEPASLKKGIIFPVHTQYVKIDSLPIYI
jgi:hypothetical protein